MIRFQGVTRRTDSNIYQFALRVPKDVQRHFQGPWAVRCSLGTADIREANDRAKALHAEWAQRFEALRSGKPAPVNLAALRAKLLHHAVATYLPAVDRLSASYSPAERREHAGTVALNRDEVLQGIAQGFVPEVAQSWLAGVLKHERSPMTEAEALPFFAMLLELRHESLTDPTRTFPLRIKRLAERQALLSVDAPSVNIGAAAPKAQAGANGCRIGDALDAWKLGQQADKTIGAFTRHAHRFATLMGDPPLSSIGKAEATQFRDKLQQWAIREGKAASTANNVLVGIRALVNVARDRGWIAGNPFERLAVKVGGKEAPGREPWTHAELRTLFHDPIWTAHRLPNASKAGAAASYWIPLIACYTGARVTEIAQLWTDDLTLTTGAEVIEFRENAERGQRLKNRGSWRAVPMHSELVRLGLPEYAQALPEGPLFPKLPTAGQNGAGGQFSHWFGKFKRDKGFTSPAKSLHSFRHLVATELRLAGAPEALADAITGHSGEGVARTVYAATIRREAERLRSVIELLRFEALRDLPKVSGMPAWAP